MLCVCACRLSILSRYLARLAQASMCRALRQCVYMCTHSKRSLTYCTTCSVFGIFPRSLGFFQEKISPRCTSSLHGGKIAFLLPPSRKKERDTHSQIKAPFHQIHNREISTHDIETYSPSLECNNIRSRDPVLNASPLLLLLVPPPPPLFVISTRLL